MTLIGGGAVAGSLPPPLFTQTLPEYARALSDRT